jgi:hypothetical protein
MTFPATPLPQKHEILINGVWTDVTTYVRGIGGRDGVAITRGYSGEQAQLSPGSVALSLNNRDNRFSNKNPTSPYYRQLGRNTQYRASIDTGVVFAKYLDQSTPGATTYDGSTIWTADKAVLDVVGDIDITVDVDAEDWRGRKGQILAAKYVRAGNQRSWLFGINSDGYLYFDWTADGATLQSVRCPLPVWPTGRIALRVLMDVDNGSGGYSVGFFTAATLLGATTPLGSTVVTTGGITSIFSSSSRVELGTFDNGGSDRGGVIGANLGDLDPFCGRMYGFRMRSGLGVGGTDVAVMDTTTRAAGDTTWSDGLSTPNTWTVTGSSYLTSYDIRFWGELPSLPRQADVSVTDVYVNARAADIIQRLTQGNNAKPLKSAVFRNLSQYAWDGYWPMEDSAVSGSGFAAYQGSPGYQTNGGFNGQPSDFLGSAGSLTFNDDTGYASGNAATSTGTPTVSTVLCYFKFTPAPSTATQLVFFNAYYAGGTAYRTTFSCFSTGFGLTINDVYGNSLVSTTSSFGGSVTPGAWIAMRLKMTASAGTITWEWAWYQINSAAPFGTSGTFSGTLSRPQSWISWPFPGKSGFQMAHVALGRMDLSFTGSDFTGSTNAYLGELWDARARRLGAEQNVQVYLQSNHIRDATSVYNKQMGAQSIASFTSLLQDCADVAGGTLFAPRDKFGLTIRAWECMINQVGSATPQLDYAQAALTGTLSPNPDDFLIENDVTLTQPDGQSFRYAKMTGSLNTQDPLANADAVGTYDVAGTTNTDLAADLAGQVYRRVLFGTWDEDRYTGIQINLERSLFVSSAALTAQIRKLDLGRAFSITNPGAWLAVNRIDLMNTGYVESLGQFQHQFVFNTRPAGPWATGIWGSSTFTTSSLWGPQSTTLNTTLTTTGTSVVITTPDVYELWTHTADYLIELAGERMTVTACSARSGSGPYTYTLTVTRSTNGVVKTISAGETVTLPTVGRWA